jgi:hypothetical protein
MLIRNCIRKAFTKLLEMKFLAAVFEMMTIWMKTRTYNMWERIVEPFHKLGYKSLSLGKTDN